MEVDATLARPRISSPLRRQLFVLLLFVLSGLLFISVLQSQEQFEIEKGIRSTSNDNNRLIENEKLLLELKNQYELLSEKDSIISSRNEIIAAKNILIQERDDMITQRNDKIQEISDKLLFTEHQLQNIKTEINLDDGHNDTPHFNHDHISSFNTTNPHPDFCPYASCHNSPLCQPCSHRFVIIIATGRSGSTTVLDMLNRLPNIRMSGENGGELLYLMNAIDNLQTGEFEQYFQYGHHEPGGAWRHNPIPEQSFACPVQGFMRTLNPPSYNSSLSSDGGDNDDNRIIGFKTIRYHLTNTFNVTTDKLCTFLTEHFPCSKVVINIRSDLNAQKESILHSFNWRVPTEILVQNNNRLLDLAKCLGNERARLIDMDEWSKSENENGESGLQIFNDVAKFLGYKNCEFPFLLHENGGKYGFASDGHENEITFSDDCQPPQ